MDVITSNDIIGIVCLCFIFILGVLLVYKELSFNNHEKSKKENQNHKFDIEKIKILLEDNSIEKIDNFINNIIKNAIDTYILLNVVDKSHYINSKEADIISNYVYATIKNTITDDEKDAIGLFYNISTEEKFDNFIKLKIKISIIALLVQNNQVIE